MSNKIIIDIKETSYSYSCVIPRKGYVTRFKDEIYDALKVFGRVGLSKNAYYKIYFISKIQEDFLRNDCTDLIIGDELE